MRRHPRPILRPTQTVRVRWLPTRSELHLLRRLRRQRQTVARNHLPAACIQNKVPRKLLFAQRQPRVRLNQQNLRLLRRVQEKVQHQALEDVHRLFQLSAGRRHHRRKDFLHARRPLAWAQQHGADPQNHEADRRPGHRTALRPTLVWPRERHQRLGEERQRRQLCVRPRHCQRFFWRSTTSTLFDEPTRSSKMATSSSLRDSSWRCFRLRTTAASSTTAAQWCRWTRP